MSAAQALETIHTWKSDRDTLYYLFVTDSLKRLVGVVSLFQLIQAPFRKPISELI